ncbi:hypothetical protein DH09_19685 [Bacillaceae bacterium JMAK1]|nr:hypothetical protein DH09_19685 [Bacillaceae bacterium JMAK1]
MSRFEVKGLHKKYGQKLLFNNLSFRFDDNRFIVLLGSNGSGKSTLLKICSGLVPFSEGTIMLGNGQERIDRAHNSSFVAEHVGFPGYLTAEDILQQQQKLYPHFDLNQAMSYCNEMNVPTQTKWFALSTGQRYLLSLIIAISTQKPFLFIDELLANLDTVKKEAMQRILTDFLLEGSRTIVMATHAYDDVEMLADGVIFIENQNATIINDLETWRIEQGTSLNDLFARVGKT